MMPASKASASWPWDWSILAIIRGGNRAKRMTLELGKAAVSDTGAALGAVQPASHLGGTLHTPPVKETTTPSLRVLVAGAAQHTNSGSTCRPCRPPPMEDTYRLHDGLVSQRPPNLLVCYTASRWNIPLAIQAIAPVSPSFEPGIHPVKPTWPGLVWQ